MTITQLVKGDTAPRFLFRVKKGGVVVDLTDATVRLKFRKKDAASNIFSRTCTISDAPSGLCFYDWQSGDLAEAGSYVGEVEITFADGKVQTCKELLKFRVRDEL